MRSNILCRERLNRILRLLDRNGGTLSIRDFSRTYGVWEWELEEAENLGWVRIFIRKPPIGRPSRVAEKLSQSQSAKLPPYRYQLPRGISIRHWRFAMESVNVMPGGPIGIKVSTYVRAYLRAFPAARSREGAYASASRLMKRRDIRIVRLWFQRSTQMRHSEAMPDTVEGIVRRLDELGLLYSR